MTTRAALYSNGLLWGLTRIESMAYWGSFYGCVRVIGVDLDRVIHLPGETNCFYARSYLLSQGRQLNQWSKQLPTEITLRLVQLGVLHFLPSESYSIVQLVKVGVHLDELSNQLRTFKNIKFTW
jgi:hypothetical protein